MWSHPHHHLQDRRNPHKGDEGRHDPGGLLLPRFSPFLSLSLSITYAFPFTYKRGSRTPHEGGGMSTWLNELNKAQLRSIFSPETWDLLPLSLVSNPYYKLVPVT